jgi:2-polyprenyl-3-methyl-5-hydroxy-6-metoxy-1,4-benzoquinol methylase
MSLAASVLRLFCYSSRPEWDEFGHLTSRNQQKVVQEISLTDRFGPGIWEALKGKKTLDYGCGWGLDVIDCAHHGIDASGVEGREFLVEGARQKAKSAGVSSSFYLNSQCPDLAGAFDCILSVNSFEHYLDPTGVLAHMRTLLTSNGMVLIYFSPPWLHPYGGHLAGMTPLPWAHMIFPERAVMRVRAEYFKGEANSYEEAGLSRMTIAKFKRAVDSSPFVLRKLELLPARNMKLLTKLPAVRELFTTAVRAELAVRQP